jgi:RNA polymerase sigma factor (sigma-70 family)
MRKLSDASLAEEIAQSVFIILARKAPFLCHVKNLSGWLHQTTLLECRHRIRTELRRKRREENAMELHQPENHSDLSLEVDDALLELSEKDRQPLLLRFFESLTLRDVGSRLGIREDAAQKRVAKSLGLLESVLRKRGREIGTTALAVALAESTQAAPASLAASVAQGAVASGGSATAIGIAFGKFMALSKTQLAAACIVAIGAPLLLQTQHLNRIRLEQQQLTATIAFHENRSTNYAESIRRLNSNRSVLEFDRQAVLNGAKQKNAFALAQNTENTAKLYKWSDSSPYIRLPKSLLDAVRLTTAQQSEMEKHYGLPGGSSAPSTNEVPGRIDRIEPIDPKGGISDSLAEALALTQNERGEVSVTIQNIASQIEAVAARHTMVTNVMPPGIDFSIPKDSKLVTLLVQEFPNEGSELKRQLTTELEYELGAERANVLMRQAASMFESDFLDFGARKRWLAAAPQENGNITIGRTLSANDTSYSGSVMTVTADSVPAELRPHLPQSLFAKHE